MADVSGKFFSAKKVRTGVSPSSPGIEVGETLPPVNPPGGALNSVGLTMPSAFNVANSPLTSNGSLDVTAAGTISQYIRGDGTLETFPSLTGYVPYTGATQNVDLGEFGVDAGFVNLDTTPTGTPTTQGTIYWDDARSTAALIMNGTIQHIGQDSFFYVKNSTGSSINKGVAVRFDGTDGASGHLKIAPFLADGTYPSTYFMGVTAEAIGNGEFGQVIHFGELEGIDTTDFDAGDLLYASTTDAGGFQTTAPVAPNNIVLIGAAVNSKNNGTIVVRPTYGSNINNDEGVKLTSVADKNLLQYQSGTGLWENKTLGQVLGGTSSQFVKGDGSLDSTSYQPLLTNPVTGTGTTNYLPKFTGASTIGNSIVQDNGSTITVGGSVNLTASTSFPTVGFLNRTSDSTLYIVSPTSGFAITDNSLNTIYNGTPTAHNWNISNALKMTLSSSGNLLIGSPPAADNGARLQVSGTGNAVRISSTSTASNVQLYITNNNNGDVYTGVSASDGTSVFTGTTAYSGYIGTNLNVPFYIATNGTVRLTIASTGAATFSSSVTATNAIFNSINSITVTAGSNIINSTYSGTDANWLTIQNAGSIFYAGLENSTSTSFGATPYAGILYLTGARNLEIFTSSVKRLTITSGGRGLFGTQTASAGASGFAANSFHVNNEIVSMGSSAGFFWENRSGGVTHSSNWYGWYTTGGVIYLYNGAANIASINTSTGAYTALSDINKKENFEASEIGLKEVLNLKPTIYSIKNDSKKERHLGFIAQEVREYIPNAYVENGEFIGLSEMPIIAALTKAIQELKQEIDTLKN